MELPKLHVPTKSEVEASQMRKQERAIMQDIIAIEKALSSGGADELLRLHRHLDGKYQYCIADWGKGMYCYNTNLGFCYDMLNLGSLQDNLELMKSKIEAFTYGWNSVATNMKTVTYDAPDVSVTVNNTVTVSITFEQVRAKIEDMTSLTDEQTKEALGKVAEIESVVKGEGSKKSKWEKIKPILTWLADKSFDVAMTILPLLLQVQG